MYNGVQLHVTTVYRTFLSHGFKETTQNAIGVKKASSPACQMGENFIRLRQRNSKKINPWTQSKSQTTVFNYMHWPSYLVLYI